jgi:membrane protein DedA with SNARE-associated domain/rhodanese-related sulfurtransferase
METVVAVFAHYGLLAVFGVVLVKQLGAPLPAMPVLLLAGAAGASDGVFAVKALAVATVASLLADFVWYFAGRFFGRRVLTLLCRISISPDSCVRKNELSFARRGIATLVIAKFVPGLSTLAPPLAGALGMGAGSFAIFNSAGAALWAGSGIAAGLIFHDQIRRLLESMSDLGHIAVWGVAALVALYVAWRIWRRSREAHLRAAVPRVAPAELAALIQQGLDPVILDVRAVGPGLPLRERIPGARHIELATIDSVPLTAWPTGAQIVTYCDCPNDASASKAAHLLGQRGLRASVLAGGLGGWAGAGYPLESVV